MLAHISGLIVCVKENTLDCFMCGKTFERYARSKTTRAEYIERIQQRNVRMMLTGMRRHPKYPDLEFKPESDLYGMQDLGEIFIQILKIY